MVGSVIPSSKAVIDKMLAPVDWANCKLFVEYGPGRRHLHRACAAADGARRDPDRDRHQPRFHPLSDAQVPDSRLFAVTGSAADVRQIIADCGFEHADYVLSGLPFSTLPPGIGPKIAEETAEALRPGGAFLVYQFTAKVRDYHGAPFRADRPRLRMGQHPALPPVLGLEG